MTSQKCANFGLKTLLAALAITYFAAGAATAQQQATIYDGITLTELETELRQITVKNQNVSTTRKTTSDGNAYLLVYLPGLDISMAALVIGPSSSRPDLFHGFTLLQSLNPSLTDSPAQVHQFNKSMPYVKLYRGGSSSVLINEVIAAGGISGNVVAQALASQLDGLLALAEMYKGASLNSGDKTIAGFAPNGQPQLHTPPVDYDALSPVSADAHRLEAEVADVLSGH